MGRPSLLPLSPFTLPLSRPPPRQTRSDPLGLKIIECTTGGTSCLALFNSQNHIFRVRFTPQIHFFVESAPPPPPSRKAPPCRSRKLIYTDKQKTMAGIDFPKRPNTSSFLFASTFQVCLAPSLLILLPGLARDETSACGGILLQTDRQADDVSPRDRLQRRWTGGDAFISEREGSLTLVCLENQLTSASLFLSASQLFGWLFVGIRSRHVACWRMSFWKICGTPL